MEKFVISLEKSHPKNTVYVSMVKRHGGACKVYKSKKVYNRARDKNNHLF